MMIDNNQLIMSLRQSQWQIAKGALKACLTYFWSNTQDEVERFREFDTLINDFIKKVEDDGLHE